MIYLKPDANVVECIMTFIGNTPRLVLFLVRFIFFGATTHHVTIDRSRDRAENVLWGRENTSRSVGPAAQCPLCSKVISRLWLRHENTWCRSNLPTGGRAKAGRNVQLIDRTEGHAKIPSRTRWPRLQSWVGHWSDIAHWQVDVGTDHAQ